MPPEQASADSARLGRASDVYGLGAILYHLLTGRPPFLAETFEATLRHVLERVPISPRQLNPTIPADLEIICLKCLEREPERRYQTSQELADELGRFLDGEPVLARPVGPTAKVWRWCRRKPALATAIGLVLLLLLVVAIGSPVAVFRISQARQSELAQLRRAETKELEARQFQYASDMNLAHQAVQDGDTFRALQLLGRHRPEYVVPASAGSASARSRARPDRLKAGLQTDIRGWEWRYLWEQTRGQERFILGVHTNGATAVGFLPDGKTVFSAGRDKFVRLWNLDSRRQVGVLEHPDAVIGAAASPDGRWLATVT